MSDSIFGDWEEFFETEIVPTDEWNEMDAYLTKDMYMSSHLTFPADPEAIFRAFRECGPEEVKVVFIGQDPYPDGTATGLAFAQEDGNSAPSLDIIKKGLEYDYECSISNFDDSLVRWARQGVLLLNTALTVQGGKPGSHAHVWKGVMQLILDKMPEYILKKNRGLIYVFVGKKAEEFSSEVQEEHFVKPIKVYHPAYEARQPSSHAFSHSKVFSLINDWLITGSQSPIDWLKDCTVKYNKPNLFNNESTSEEVEQKRTTT